MGGGGGGKAYTWTNICVLKTLFFVQAIVIFFKFSAHNISLLLTFIFDDALTTVNTALWYIPKFNVMFKFNYSKYNPRGIIFGGGGLIHGRNFPFQKVFPKRPGLINGGAYRNLRYYIAKILRAF